MKNLWALHQQHPDTDPLNEQKAVSLWLTQLCMPWSKNTSDWSAKKEEYGGRIMEIHQRFGTYQPCVPCDAHRFGWFGGWVMQVSTHGTVAPLAVRSFCQSSPNFLSLPWTAVYWWFIASGARLLVGSLSTHQKNLKVTSTGWNSGRIYSSFYGRKYCDCCPVSQNFICAVPICKAVTAFLNSGSVWKKSPEHLHDQGISARALLVSLEVRPSKLHSDSQLTKNRVWHYGMVWHQVEYTDTMFWWEFLL